MNPEPQGKLPYVIVLAANTRQGYRYAKLAKLPKGRHRVVYSAKQIRRLRSAEIHILPGFMKRPDRHSILAALRYTRGERLEVQMPDWKDPRGELTDRQLEVAYRYNGLWDDDQHRRWLEAAEVPKPELPPVDQGDGLGEQLTIDGDQAPVEQPVRRRRSRCKVCEELVIGDDDLAHNAAAHEAHEAKLLGKPDPAQQALPTATDFFGGR